MRIALVGAYNMWTGYGNDLCALGPELMRQGQTVIPFATNISAGLPEPVTSMFRQDPRGKFDLLLSHQPPFDLKPQDDLRRQCEHAIGWTMWEQTEFSRHDMAGHNQGRWPWRQLDRIACYDEVTRSALDHYDPKVPKIVIPGGVKTDDWNYIDRDFTGPFRFFMEGALGNRKDPWIAIEAFHELRQDGELADAELNLKSNIAGLHPYIEEIYPGVHVSTGLWSRQMMLDWYGQQHCYISTSRGEGKNLPALQAQLTGVPCIATNWGGHTTWLHRDYAYPLDYDLELVDPNGTSKMARASKEHLKQLMLYVYGNRAEVRQRGKIASSAIRQTFGWDQIVKRLLREVAQVFSS